MIKKLMAGLKKKDLLEDSPNGHNNATLERLNQMLESSPKMHHMDDYRKKIPDEEFHFIEDFLDKFVFISDASISKD
jgi:hypothetical protein